MFTRQYANFFSHTLAVSLGKLDLDLTSTNPFAVQVVEGVFCIPDIFERAVLLRPFILKFGKQGQKSGHMHNSHKEKAATQVDSSK